MARLTRNNARLVTTAIAEIEHDLTQLKHVSDYEEAAQLVVEIMESQRLLIHMNQPMSALKCVFFFFFLPLSSAAFCTCFDRLLAAATSGPAVACCCARVFQSRPCDALTLVSLVALAASYCALAFLALPWL